jgi:gliding motility-associated-like protein
LVHPGADVSQIRWNYEGVSSYKEKDGNIELGTSLGKTMEMKPEAFLETEQGKSNVPCAYRLKKGEISFEFPEGYDTSAELVIDPVLIFSTFTGAASDNWGFTATYDSHGNGYAGGIAFGFGYPLSTGAFQTAYNGGKIDVSISKFNYNGTSLLFSTFLGGNHIEMPHSMVVDSQDNLIVMGNTGSPNFPVSTTAYDNSFNGGNPTPANSILQITEYAIGSDIFVTKLNPTGTNMIGSTFIGGSANDGLNASIDLKHNYADDFRGEVIVDPQDNIVVVSSTSSSNFPTVSPFQASYGGGVTDACVFKMNPTLSTLMFSSYFGGSGNDAGYGIQMNTQGQFYFCGGTTSSNLQTTGGVINPSYSGSVDGYIVRLPPTGGTILACTYIGTPRYNQSYFVQLDKQDNVFVTGQSIGGYPIVAGPSGTIYSSPGGGQFVHKLNPALTSTLMSTCFGNSTFPTNIVPSAFLVENCNLIYISGWGRDGSSSGLPVTPNAYKGTTDGSDFYFMVLKENATMIHYATFFGANQTNTPGEHVDGGTSRFDKDGIIYQAICAGCQGQSALPTTPGAYSSTNNSTNCNLAIIKFDVSDYTAAISPDVTPLVCVGENVVFTNLSTGGISYMWHFGDGDSSSAFNTNHIYSTPGIYNVMLVAYQPSYCFPTDTAYTTVEVLGPINASVTPVSLICPGASVTLNAAGGTSYQWLPADGLPSNQMGLQNPTVSPLATTTYTVVVSNTCANDTAQITVPVIDFSINVSNNDTICIGSSKQLQASGGTSYQWSPTTALSNPSIANPIATPNASIIYTVTVTNPDGCVLKDSSRITVDNFPQVQAGPDHVICEGESVGLSASGATFFHWSPPIWLNNPNIANPICTPLDTIQYVVTGSNSCGDDGDTLTVFVKETNPIAGPDTIICPGTAVQLYAYGGATFKWTPSAYLDNPNSQFPIARPATAFTYTVQITDTIGCVSFDTLRVRMFPPQHVSTGPNQYIEFGESVKLIATGGSGSYVWSPPYFLSCTACPNPVASPQITTSYELSLTDSNNCTFRDSITVFVGGDLFVPNVFTPGDVNNLNDIFLSLGRDIEKVEMMIFNRWGELLYSTQDKNDGWDGKYKGKLCPLGVYVWKIHYTETSGRTGNLIGHVTLLR